MFVTVSFALTKPFFLCYFSHILFLCVLFFFSNTHTQIPTSVCLLTSIPFSPGAPSGPGSPGSPFCPYKKKHTHTLLSRTEPNLDKSNMKVFFNLNSNKQWSADLLVDQGSQEVLYLPAGRQNGEVSCFHILINGVC